MIEQDTIKLLRECDAGVKMGVASIDDVLDRVHSEKLRQRLIACKAEHEKLKGEINGLLDSTTTRARSRTRSPRACPG